MFIVLSVVSKDVVDLWEAVITFLMFPLVVILAFLVECQTNRDVQQLPVVSTVRLGGKEFLRFK